LIRVEGFQSGVELEDEGSEEGVEGFGAVELDWDVVRFLSVCEGKGRG